jgi:mono/diheme cytochrome c family protein
MGTKRTVTLLVLASALFVGAVVARANGMPAAAAPADGKAIFLANKCNTCHTIQAAGIEKRKASTADADESKEKLAVKPPDLSSVGLERKAEWIGKFMMKTEVIKGEKHPRKFRGTEPELKVLATWLESQKAPKKK